MGDNKSKPISNNGGSIGCAFFLILFIVLMIALISNDGGGKGNSPSSTRSARCHICERTFTDAENVRSIRNTNMCTRCYSNYRTLQDMNDSLGNKIPRINAIGCIVRYGSHHFVHVLDSSIIATISKSPIELKAA